MRRAGNAPSVQVPRAFTMPAHAPCRVEADSRRGAGQGGVKCEKDVSSAVLRARNALSA